MLTTAFYVAAEAPSGGPAGGPAAGAASGASSGGPDRAHQDRTQSRDHPYTKNDKKDGRCKDEPASCRICRGKLYMSKQGQELWWTKNSAPPACVCSRLTCVVKEQTSLQRIWEGLDGPTRKQWYAAHKQSATSMIEERPWATCTIQDKGKPSEQDLMHMSCLGIRLNPDQIEELKSSDWMTEEDKAALDAALVWKTALKA